MCWVHSLIGVSACSVSCVDIFYKVIPVSYVEIQPHNSVIILLLEYYRLSTDWKSPSCTWNIHRRYALTIYRYVFTVLSTVVCIVFRTTAVMRRQLTKTASPTLKERKRRRKGKRVKKRTWMILSARLKWLINSLRFFCLWPKFW